SLVVLAPAPALPIQESARPYIWVIPVASVGLALQTLFGAAILGLQKIKQLALAAAISQPLLVLTLLILAQSGNLASLVTATALSYLLVALILFLPLRRDLHWPSVPWPETRQRFLGYAGVVSVITFIDAVVWQRSEVLFLGVLTGGEAVAYYALAYGLSATAMKLIPGAFSGILMPTVTETYLSEERWVLRRRFWRATLLVAGVVIPMIIAGYFIAPVVIPILYGGNYQPVIDAFRVVLVGGGFGAVASVASAVFYGTERPTFILKFGLVVAIINISLDFVLISQHGLLGAAWANTISQGIGGLGGILYAGWILK